MLIDKSLTDRYKSFNDSYFHTKKRIEDINDSLNNKYLELQNSNLILQKQIEDIESKISKSNNKIKLLKNRNEKYKVFIDSLPIPY